MITDLSVPLLISRVITLIVALTVHEFSHAFVADRFGDDTPRLNGRLTLNPLKHLDLIGSLMLIIVGFGWAKPVMVNPVALRRHSRSAFMWVSLAGPASNLLMALLATIPIRFHLIPAFVSPTMTIYIYVFLSIFVSINLVLAVFNLIPISPLDGEKVLDFLLPQEWAEQYAKLRPYGPILLMAVFMVLPRLGVNILGPIINGMQTFLLGG